MGFLQWVSHIAHFQQEGVQGSPKKEAAAATEWGGASCVTQTVGIVQTDEQKKTRYTEFH